MRLLLITFAALGLVAFAACGDDDDDTSDDATSGSEATEAGQTPGDSPPEVDGESTTTASGLEYIEIEEGDGAAPSETSMVTIHYTGWIAPDGPKFDSSLDGGQPATFSVSGVIPGFSEGILLMKEGGKARLIIPSELGYGAQGQGPIPPNSDLIFDVELITVS